MAKVSVSSGICGFSIKIIASSDDGQNVKLAFETDCPNIARAQKELKEVDAYQELFAKPHETSTYKIFSQYIPHISCPIYTAIFKAIEVASGMALPKDVTIKIEN